MNNNELMELQNQHIKGITIKLGWQVLASTVAITASFVGGVFLLKQDISNVRAEIKEYRLIDKIENSEYKAEIDKKLNLHDFRINSIEYSRKLKKD